MTGRCVECKCAFLMFDKEKCTHKCTLGLNGEYWEPERCRELGYSQERVFGTTDMTGPTVTRTETGNAPDIQKHDAVNAPSHYVGKIEVIDYLRDKLTPAEFTGFCIGNVLKYTSRWRKKDGVQDLKKAKVYLEWAIENEDRKQD